MFSLYARATYYIHTSFPTHVIPPAYEVCMVYRFRRVNHMLVFGQNSAIDSDDRAQTRLIYSYISLVTLKIRSMSLKSDHPSNVSLLLYHWFMRSSVDKANLYSHTSLATLQIRARSLKSNRLLPFS